ncbi:HAD-IIB family hydrolase [Candidatus Gracilibacteria bacterium]|nr:HAD-IIB family hydrolase [Candidatus Gracilibacteria bacterium]
MMNFKAAMFDFDGTLTEKGHHSPSKEIADALVNLSQKMPIGFCTGRQLESFERRALSKLLEHVSDEERPRFMENLYLFSENGAIGYDFNPAIKDFEEIYRIEWPSEFIDREKLRTILNEEVKEYGEILYNAHKIVVVMGTKFYYEDKPAIDKVYELADKIYEIVIEVLKKINPDYSKYVHVGNSGIGVIISPANGDKDEAVEQFGKFLSENRGMKFDAKYSEILTAGDSAQVGGNDFYFLSGRFGTPYSVGEILPDNPKLQSVKDENGKRILHSKGTLKLIQTLL